MNQNKLYWKEGNKFLSYFALRPRLSDRVAFAIGKRVSEARRRSRRSVSWPTCKPCCLKILWHGRAWNTSWKFIQDMSPEGAEGQLDWPGVIVAVVGSSSEICGHWNRTLYEFWSQHQNTHRCYRRNYTSLLLLKQTSYSHGSKNFGICPTTLHLWESSSFFLARE